MRFDGSPAMVKERNFFRKQAKKAELMARGSTDAEVAQGFANLARAYRSQADTLKGKKKGHDKN
jgi:hypothetical protein